MNEWMVHQLLIIIKKERKIPLPSTEKSEYWKKYCMYLWLLLPKKPSWNILCFEVKKIVLTQFLDKKCTPYIPAIFSPFTEESNNK